MFVVVRENEKKKIDRRERSGRVQPLLLLSCDGGGLLFFNIFPWQSGGKSISWARGFFLCLAASRVSRGTTIE
jgi:hypothetical protein